MVNRFVSVDEGNNLPADVQEGQILGATLPYTARGSLVVLPTGNVSVYTKALTTTLQVSLVCVCSERNSANTD